MRKIILAGLLISAATVAFAISITHYTVPPGFMILNFLAEAQAQGVLLARSSMTVNEPLDGSFFLAGNQLTVRITSDADPDIITQIITSTGGVVNH